MTGEARAFSVGFVTPVTVAAFVTGRREGIIGRIGVKMAIDTICESALAAGTSNWISAEDCSGRIVRNAMKEANTRVHRYAARMLSGDKLGVDAVLAAFDGTTVAMCRVGLYEGFLFRDAKFFPLFEAESTLQRTRFLGNEERITVDFVSVPVEPHDTFILGTFDLAGAESAFSAFVAQEGPEFTAEKFCNTLAHDLAGSREGFVSSLQIELPAIPLAQVAQ